jgi:transposase
MQEQTYEPITEHQWNALESLFPKPIKRGRGKPHAPWRSVLNSILFVLHTGSKWDALPKREENPLFAPKSVAHRWFCRWEKEGFLLQVLNSLAEPEALSTRASSMPRRKRLSKAQKLESNVISA